MSEPRLHPNRPLQFRNGTSRVHRADAGLKLLVATALGALALAFDDPLPLAALAIAIGGGYAAARLAPLDLWKDARWLLLQGALIVGITMLVRSWSGFGAGLRTASQLVLLFLPVALVLRTTSSDALLDRSQRWMPERMRFAAGATLRFIPFFARELAELTEMQRLRGARLHARDAWRPSAWHDWLACVALPMTVRAIEVAEEASDAAAIRGVGQLEQEN